MITETEILSELKSLEFPPLRISPIELAPRLSANNDIAGILTVEVASQTIQFAVQCKARSTPRIFDESLRQLQELATRGLNPLLVVPFLRDVQLAELERRQLSGIDLSGNGVVCVPEQLLIYRTGAPNRYPDSSPTKYAYRGTTSLVSRAFLCRSVFSSLAEIVDEIETRGGSVAISTVSKALKRLQSDLIVDKTNGEYRLLQPDKLLERLGADYAAPKITKTATFSNRGKLADVFAAVNAQTRLILSGRSSVEAFAVMARDECPILYTSSINAVVGQLGTDIEETSRFVDFELRQTIDPTVYFDGQSKDGLMYASPVQTFLELNAGDKREREVAEQIRAKILSESADGEQSKR